ncbi:aminoacyl-tRNA hydrolase [Nitratireductor sp. L1-7-SE]|uniref:Peptidyl-tRNA hydrolase n=1 Tax=Nitratireductor rhodophyticola TaxID=2854036 RepID=A0ABS7RAR6_9HYPH|nr:aminoacyl-tRNA hydrolase [Nitratireductor rhodophyticola]MBY8917482.1 aminoacyl-tRNA hydrolase [Nitratireductor rhodophyticola]MBY8922193.1 aminoacyl-tRNA hydrolase [Nitratireductor rhodophyticola]
MLLIAGLGNPGQQYERHRHNVGFMAADAIARRHSFSSWSKKFNALVAEGRLGGEKVLLIKPQTFMNLSGQAIGEAMRFYKIDLDDLIVFYDELDLAPGKLRIKTGGGSGGHNGIKSIDAHCGKDYRRVRIGIGHPGDKARVNTHVLGDFAKADQTWLEPMLDAVADNIAMLAEGDESGFMNRVSLAVKGTGAEPGEKRDSKPAKKQSHIRQARQKGPAAPLPESGPMAAMLKKLLGQKE